MSAANIPAPQSPIADPSTGGITTPWWFYLQSLLNRTGGVSGGAFGSIRTVTVGISPFAYTAPDNGEVVVSGGGVFAMTITRGGIVVHAGGFYGSHRLVSGDVITISYVLAPSVTFLPG